MNQRSISSSHITSTIAIKTTKEQSTARTGAKKGNKPLNVLAVAFEHEESKH